MSSRNTSDADYESDDNDDIATQESQSIPYLSPSHREEAYEYEVLVQAYLRDVHYSSKRQTIVKLFHAILNASLVVLPFAACQAGIPLYTGSIIAMSTISAYSSVMLIRMANENSARTLEDLAEVAFGPMGFFIVCIGQLLFSITLMCISLEVWSDIVHGVSNEIFVNKSSVLYDDLTSRVSIVILGGLLVLPFCLLTRSMATLAWSSYFTMIGVMGGLIVVIASFYLGYAETDDDTKNDYQYVASVKPGWWMVVFVIGMSFSYNQKSFVVYNCLRHRDTSRWRYSVTRSHIIIATLYILLGVFGYLSDNEILTSNSDSCRNRFNYFATDYDHVDRTIFQVARFLIALALLAAFPVDSLVAVTTWKRFHRRWIRFKRSTSGTGSSFNSNNEEITEADRQSLLYRLLEMPAVNNTRAVRSDSVMTRIGETLLPCIFWDDSADSDDETPAAERSTTDEDRNDQNNRASSNSRQSNMSGISDISGSKSRNVSEGQLGEDPSLMDIQSLIQTEQTLNHIRGSTSRANLSAITSRRPSDAGSVLSRRNTYMDDSMGLDLDLENVTEENTSLTVNPNMTVVVLDDVMEDEPMLRRNRHSSLARVLTRQRSLQDVVQDMVPAATIWVLCVSICLWTQEWGIIAGCIGMLSTALLVFIIPSMIYFRVGALSDYQATPLWCTNTLPNRMYMLILQIIGLFMLIIVLLTVVYAIAEPTEANGYGYSDDISSG